MGAVDVGAYGMGRWDGFIVGRLITLGRAKYYGDGHIYNKMGLRDGFVGRLEGAGTDKGRMKA